MPRPEAMISRRTNLSRLAAKTRVAGSVRDSAHFGAGVPGGGTDAGALMPGGGEVAGYQVALPGSTRVAAGTGTRWPAAYMHCV